MAEKDEFKFPDEIEVTVGEPDDIKVEVVDDTPAQDRGRAPMPKEIVEELENDDLEEYSEKVKRRLGQMKKVWHDERRAKESTIREKDEALRFAQQQFEENKQLKQRLGRGEKALVSEVTKAATNELATSKARLTQAYESGDASLIADAQEAMTDAKIKLKEYERYRPSLQDDNNEVQTKQQVQAPAQVVDPKAEAWRQQNTWFGADKAMTALALGLHEELVESGVDTRSDEYYAKLNRTMRKRFPENFEDEQAETVEKTPPRKAATVVAPATRSTSPRQVRLTSSQVALAKRLGVSNEAYAREMMKQENDNGR